MRRLELAANLLFLLPIIIGIVAVLDLALLNSWLGP